MFQIQTVLDIINEHYINALLLFPFLVKYFKWSPPFYYVNGTVRVILRDPPCEVSNVRLAKLLSDQKCER